MYEVKINNHGSFSYRNDAGNECSAIFPLKIIRDAWSLGCNYEDLADGFGAGHGTMGGDWSGIRDSSEKAIARMFERSMMFLYTNAQQNLKRKQDAGMCIAYR